MPPLRPAQHHRIGVGVHSDAIRNLPAFADAHHTVLTLRISAPHAPLGVEADAIRTNGRGQLRPDPAVSEGSVLMEIEGCQAMAERFAKSPSASGAE